MAGKILSGRAVPAVAGVAILAAVLIASAAALLRLNVNNDPSIYFPESAHSVVLNKELRARFPTDQLLIALFRGDVYSDRFLKALGQVSQRFEGDPNVQRVLSVLSVDHIAGSDDGFSVDPLLGGRGAARLNAEARRARVLDDRFAPGMLASRDGRSVALVIRPAHLHQSWEGMALQTKLRQAVREAGIEGQLAAVGGQVAVQTAEFRSMIRDTLIFLPGVFFIGLAFFWVMFRRWIAVVTGAAAMAAVVLATVALFALYGKPYTLVTAMMPPLMASLTAALLIHLFNSFALASERGLAGAERVAWACRNIERPARFTALTTAGGLVSLSLSPILPIDHFGFVAAAGTLLIYVVCVILLPPIFARWDRRPWPRRGTGLQWADALVRVISGIGIRYAGIVVTVTAMAMAAAVPLLYKVNAETDLLKFFSPTDPISRSTETIERNLAGVTSLELVFKGDHRDALKDPRRLQDMRAVEKRIAALPQVDRVLSMADIVEEMNWGFHGEDPAYRRVPADANLISQYLLIYDGKDLYDLVDHDFREARLLISAKVHGSSEINELTAKIRRIMTGSRLDGVQWDIGGSGRLFADQDRLLIKGQVHSLWGALALTFLLLVMIWRSVPASLLTMLPNVAPVLVMFAVMGAAGIWLDMATAMIASVVVGIAVDDTIHLYHKYRNARSAGAGAVLALGRAYHDAGRAVVVTSVILCAQFSVLTLSHFRPTMEFGLLAAVGLGSALFFDLLLLPALLALPLAWRGRMRKPVEGPVHT